MPLMHEQAADDAQHAQANKPPPQDKIEQIELDPQPRDVGHVFERGSVSSEVWDPREDLSDMDTSAERDRATSVDELPLTVSAAASEAVASCVHDPALPAPP